MTPSLRTAAGRVRSDERGITLVELLVAMSIGIFVIGIAYTILTGVLIKQTAITDRVDATARGRLGMERITRQIRSQQCLDTSTSALQWAGDYGLQFYASVAAPRSSSQRIQKRRIEWIPSPGNSGFLDGGPQVGDILETVWESLSDAPPYVFPTNPTKRSTLADDVELIGATPVFRYFGYELGPIGRPAAVPYPLVANSDAVLNPRSRPSVAVANLPRVVLIEIRYAARPRHNKVDKTITVPFSNRVSVRTADPSDPDRSPLCL